MATYARKLKDASGNFVAPATRASCVYMSDNTTLEDFVNDLDLRVTGIYPVGSVYQSFEDTSPASMFGGEWEKLENTFLYGSGTKSVGATGGEENHQLTVAELSNVKGSFRLCNFITTRNNSDSPIEYADGVFTRTYDYYMAQTIAGDIPQGNRYRTVNMNFGGDRPHNNMPPYTVINIWKRVA